MSELSQKNFTLTITAEKTVSTDSRFTMANLSLGDNYKPLDVYYKPNEGEIEYRRYAKGEWRSTNQTLPRLACQVFEEQLLGLSTEERLNFPVCQYRPESDVIRGIFESVEAFKQYRNSIESVVYRYDVDKQMVFYCWNIFSTVVFVSECLKRFGHQGDSFVLTYTEKEKRDQGLPGAQEFNDDAEQKQGVTYNNPYSESLLQAKNIIFRGAPGTGKSYLAREIATDIISHGEFDDYTQLTDQQKQQVEFVQFHPSYDYSDFVEGLRPTTSEDGAMSFELQDGVFKRFVARAQRNLDNSRKSPETISREVTTQEMIDTYFENVELGVDQLQTLKGTKFVISGFDEKHINISIPENQVSNKLKLNINELRTMLESDQTFTQVKEVVHLFNKTNATQNFSYDLALYADIRAKMTNVASTVVEPESMKPYVFIIDEINRGEISKIFGELFFSIDPEYRGPAGEVSTQYANLHENPSEKFSIPENVFIIGTMNDIDRSVDTFDFAMRRRFRFIEIKADDRLEMLDCLGEELKMKAVSRMTALNQAISDVDELNDNYHVGASYFLKLQEVSFAQLWTDYLAPLLRDYVRGMYDEDEIMGTFRKAYNASPADNPTKEPSDAAQG
ncbi:McrB family protein [Lacticaseibacillus kribbianus]|uniref:McrB family protein n=1 Tax=Lacticaseibacillus kribbianus TaxID=2926292 RepID=UPI001CD48890|nr:AAA family ATPase [Lacticaseibacillus kribbianus]